jgi:hypothetical protein
MESDEAPDELIIHPQKQAGHVVGTPQYTNRVKQAKPTGAFPDHETAEQYTKEAWEKGSNPDRRKLDRTRQYDFGRDIPGVIDPDGNPTSKVRVHRDSKGYIHGYPVPK